MNDAIIKEIRGTVITVAVGDKAIDIDLMKVLAIDEEDLTREFTHQAALYAYFATLEASAEREVSTAKLSKETEEAQADSQYRADFERDGKKYTEAVIKAMVSTDEQVYTHQLQEVMARYDDKLLKAIVAALEMRANMLISLGSHMRHELNQQGMTIKDREFEASKDNVKKVLQSRNQHKQV